MTHRKGTFKPASARSKKAALAASDGEPGEFVHRDSWACENGLHGHCGNYLAGVLSSTGDHLCECSCHPACGSDRGCRHE